MPGDKKLAIILPVDSSSPDLCKVISSAVALGYPAPVLVNWKKDFHTDKEGIGPSHLGKITGTLDYLEWATNEDGGATADQRLADSDIVLMMDAHDVWLQLPPNLLLERYLKTLQQSKARMKAEQGFWDAQLLDNSIIVSAQKGCVAPRDTFANLHCDIVPESILPDDVYGTLTDVQTFSWATTRPKFLNSGTIMGPAGDLKKYFRRAKTKLDKRLGALSSGDELGGDQGIFAEIYGEQEIWRRRIRQTYQTGDLERRLSDTAVSAGNKFEYHIALDYAQDLFYPTCNSEDDGYFVTLDDAGGIEETSSRHGVSPARVRGVPADLNESQNPLEVLGEGTHGVLDWGAMSVYADFWTTAVPVAVHHNAWKNGLKERRSTWWDKLWFFPYLRLLLERQIELAKKGLPLATFRADDEGTLSFWPYDGGQERRQPMLFGQKVGGGSWDLHGASWDEVCRRDDVAEEAEFPWHDEVFRDGLGPF